MRERIVNVLVWLGIFLTSCGLVALLSLPALAQEHHEEGHIDYSGWSSQKMHNCCNNQDCGDLAKEQWRESATGDEIKIRGQWCPVKTEHYVIRGKSPNGERAHACVSKDGNFMDDCDRLLCFMGVPKI